MSLENPNQAQEIIEISEKNFLIKILYFLKNIIFRTNGDKNKTEIQKDLKEIIKIIQKLNKQNKNYFLSNQEIELVKKLTDKIREEWNQILLENQKSKGQAKIYEDDLSIQENNFQSQIEKLEKQKQEELNKLQKELSERKQDRRKLMVEVGSIRRDKIQTQNLENSDIRNDLLVNNEYANLRSNSNNLVKIICKILIDNELLPNLKNISREETGEKIQKEKAEIRDKIQKEKAKIQAILFEKILISNGNDKIFRKFSQQIIKLLSDIKGVDLKNQLDNSNTDFNNLVKQLLELITNKDDTDNCLNSQGNIKKQFIDEIRESIYDELLRSFAISLESLKSTKLDDGLNTLISNSINLREKMMMAEPPARLEIYPENTLFDNDKHEDIFAGEEGLIEVTVFPAYVTGDEVSKRALVMLKPKK